ncbi:hypothetical protein AQUCO_00200112v1 [Aquilegia coerulea]|uniref:Uncharacterized protein n=1 Tax=Aquilegia coerulea TaxID=218851 RepID=A0A2G5F1J9_AQUCA|nr:hypothetical protein AQUCO_00200112v1 [Aquilegia coerulea]PIA61893.1 hypothetical protein AQUCO_00200112v1 [Aquilegia coerulea]
MESDRNISTMIEAKVRIGKGKEIALAVMIEGVVKGKTFRDIDVGHTVEIVTKKCYEDEFVIMLPSSMELRKDTSLSEVLLDSNGLISEQW